MASSRLEKVGTIFTRASGLLKSGAMKQADKPIWYDVYQAFPPKFEPRVDRGVAAVDDQPIRQIFYEEDEVRAKFYKRFRHVPAVNLSETNPAQPFLSQQFITKFFELKKLPENQSLSSEDLFVLAVSQSGLDLKKFEAPVKRKQRESKMEDNSLSQAFTAAVLSSKSLKASKIDVGELMKDVPEDK